MPVIYVKIHSIFHETAVVLDFFLLKWDQNSALGFRHLFKPDSYRIIFLETFISQKMDIIQYISGHLRFIRPASIRNVHKWIP